MNLGATSPTPELDGLLARSPIAMLLADDQRRYVDVNEAACALLGLSRAELLEAGVDGLTPVATARTRAGVMGPVPLARDDAGRLRAHRRVGPSHSRHLRRRRARTARASSQLPADRALAGIGGRPLATRTRRGDPRGARTDEQRDRPRTLALPGHRRNPLPQRCQTTERPQPSSRHRPRPNPRGDRPASPQRRISEKARTWPQTGYDTNSSNRLMARHSLHLDAITLPSFSSSR